MSTLSISIDDFSFKLLERNPNAYGNRGIIHIISTNMSDRKEMNFMLYRSNSDLGFWRLCYTKGKGDQFQFLKGRSYNLHYVQTTFVDIRLQIFINENLEKVPINEDMNCFDIYNSDSGVNENKIKVENMIDTRRGTRVGLPIPMEYFDIFPERLNNYHSYVDIDYGYSRHKRLLFLKKYGECGKKVTEHQVLQGSIFLEDNYDFVKDEKIGPYDFATDDDSSFSLDLKSQLGYVQLRKKNDKDIPDELTIYYLHIANLTIVDKKETEADANTKTIENIFLPIFISPSENKINEFGLFNTYIDLGAYVCKIIDYTKNCEKIGSEYKCSMGYSIQSYLYKDPIFPFNVITGNNSIQPEIEVVRQENEKNKIKSIQKFKGLIPSLEAYKQNMLKYDELLFQKQFGVHTDHDKLEEEIAHHKALLVKIDEEIDKFQKMQDSLSKATGGKRKPKKTRKKKNKKKRKKNTRKKSRLI